MIATGCADDPGDQAADGSMSARAIAELRADASRVVDAADGATRAAGEHALEFGTATFDERLAVLTSAGEKSAEIRWQGRGDRFRMDITQSNGVHRWLVVTRDGGYFCESIDKTEYCRRARMWGDSIPHTPSMLYALLEQAGEDHLEVTGVGSRTFVGRPASCYRLQLREAAPAVTDRLGNVQGEWCFDDRSSVAVYFSNPMATYTVESLDADPDGDAFELPDGYEPISGPEDL